MNKRSESLDYVIPVYNGEKFLRAAVLSCLEQQLIENLKVRVVVVDDGSEDQTPALLQELRQNNSRVVVLRQPNAGESAAVNAGVNVGDSHYVCVLSADDLVEPNHSLELVGHLRKNPEAIAAYPDWFLINEDGRTLKRVRVKNYSKDRLWNNFDCTPGPGAVIRRSAISSKLRSQNYQYVDDYHQWLSLSLRGDLAPVHKTLASWRTHESQATRQGSSKVVLEQLSLLEEMAHMGNEEFNMKRAEASLLTLHIRLGVQESKSPISNLFRAISQLRFRDRLNLLATDPVGLALSLISAVNTRERE